jgi:hypothetical protein
MLGRERSRGARFVASAFPLAISFGFPCRVVPPPGRRARVGFHLVWTQAIRSIPPRRNLPLPRACNQRPNKDKEKIMAASEGAGVGRTLRHCLYVCLYISLSRWTSGAAWAQRVAARRDGSVRFAFGTARQSGMACDSSGFYFCPPLPPVHLPAYSS